MTFIIPPQQSKKHSQTNKNDISGTIYQSRNISLDEEGYIKLAATPIAYYTQDSDSAFNAPDAMYPMNSSLYINANQVFTGYIDSSFSLSNRSTDTNSPSPGVEEDLCFFNNKPVVSDGTVVKYEGSSGVWTSVTVSGGSWPASGPVCMTPWDYAGHLAVARGNVVKFINTSWAVNATVLVLPAEYKVESMATNGTTLYMSTRNASGGEAKIFTVNSIKATHDSQFPAGTFELPTIKSMKSSIVALDVLGRFSRFSGGGLTQLAQLPVYNTRYEWADASNDYSVVSNRGLVVDGDLAYMNIVSKLYQSDKNFLPHFQSGVWVYDDSINSIYHRSAPSYTTVQKVAGTDVTVSTSNNDFTLTFGNLNNVITGMPVVYDGSSTTVIPELKTGGCYFIIKVSSTKFKLATTYANAIANTAIDITGTGTTSQSFLIYKTNDYGWSYMPNIRTSIAVLNSLHYNGVFFENLVFTGDLTSKQDMTTNVSVLTALSPFVPNRGYVVTPKLESDKAEDKYQSLFIKHDPLVNDDKIIVKYKTKVKSNYPKDSCVTEDTASWMATWTDTDTFTTTLDLSDAEVGDEIEITAGVGSGHLSHISSLTNNAGTWTVNLTEAFPFAVSGDEFYFIIDNWTYLNEFNTDTPTNLDGYSECGINVQGQFLQLKIEMRGVGVRIKEIQVANQTHKGITLYN